MAIPHDPELGMIVVMPCLACTWMNLVVAARPHLNPDPYNGSK